MIDKTFIVIMGAGRCGTSSLVSYLNSKPNFNIYGENAGAITKILSGIINLDETYRYSENDIKTSFHHKYNEKGQENCTEWYNNRPNLLVLKNHIINNIINFFDSECYYIGFKDIRWLTNIEGLSVLESIYERVKYIHLTRDLQDHINSFNNCKNFFKEQTNVEEYILSTNTKIQEYLLNKPNYTCNISLESNFLEKTFNFIVS